MSLSKFHTEFSTLFLLTLATCLVLTLSAPQRSTKAMQQSAVSLSMKELSVSSTQHLCSKYAFNKCERRFEEHVGAVAAFKAGDGEGEKEGLWCQVLSSHGSCMREVLDHCMADYPRLSGRVEDFLKQVVHKACTHEGNPAVKSCVQKMKKKSAEKKSLYDLAHNCRKANGQIDPSVKSLIDLLHNLQRSRQHLYKRLPTV